MNGATTEPWESTSSEPRTSRNATMGRSHHFLRSRRNSQNSLMMPSLSIMPIVRYRLSQHNWRRAAPSAASCENVRYLLCHGGVSFLADMHGIQVICFCSLGKRIREVGEIIEIRRAHICKRQPKKRFKLSIRE